MELHKILKADYLDILFDNRNKSYGGYELRKFYYKRLKNALAFVLLTAGTAVTYPVIAGRTNASDNHRVIPPIILTPIDPLADVQKKIETPPAPPPPQKIDMAKWTVPTIEIDEKVPQDEVLAENRTLENRQIGAINSEGDPSTEQNPLVPSTGGSLEGVQTDLPSGTPVDWVPQMPEFDGNLNKWLVEHTNYPESARANGIEGKVIARFVVSEDGSISDVKIVRALEGGCSEEAERVLRSMPRWKPGKNNGTAVKVYYTLPVVFKLE